MNRVESGDAPGRDSEGRDEFELALWLAEQNRSVLTPHQVVAVVAGLSEARSKAPGLVARVYARAMSSGDKLPPNPKAPGVDSGWVRLQEDGVTEAQWYPADHETTDMLMEKGLVWQPPQE